METNKIIMGGINNTLLEYISHNVLSYHRTPKTYDLKKTAEKF